jgi:hypothetical protein
VPLPAFDEHGALPDGEHVLTLDELRDSYLVTGEAVQRHADEEWDSDWRARLVRNLAILVTQLGAAGVTETFIDGSFVTDKPRPNDIDGYFVPSPATQQGALRDRWAAWEQVRQNLLRTSPLWDWESPKVWSARTQKFERQQWHRFHVDLYPHVPDIVFAEYDGQLRRKVEYPEYFRRDRETHRSRGIVRIGGMR